MYSTDPRLVKARGKRREITSNMVREAERARIKTDWTPAQMAYAKDQAAFVPRYGDRLGYIAGGLGANPFPPRGPDGRCPYCGR